MSLSAELVAQSFHEHYERLAPLYDWETQSASRVDWFDLPDNQRNLMVHVVEQLMADGVIDR